MALLQRMDFILEIVWLQPYLPYIYGFGRFEVWLAIFLTAILVLFLVYRWFGTGAVLAFLIIYLIIYTLYAFDITGRSKSYESYENERLQLVEDELERK